MTAQIYISTHCDFNPPVHHPVYKVLDSRELFPDDKYWNGMDCLFYSELASYKELTRHPQDLPDIIGFCGYRKYYSFLDDVPDLEQIINEHGCITTSPYMLGDTVYNQYAYCFNAGDMDVMKALVRNRDRQLYKAFCQMLENDWLYTCNMFIVKKETFLEMMDITWQLIDDYLDVVGVDLLKRIKRLKYIYLKNSKNVPLQFRIGGNLGERVISAYLLQHYPNAKTYDIVFTENPRKRKVL